MKRAFLLFILATTALLSCHNNRQPEEKNEKAPVIIPLVTTPFYYAQLKGQVGGRMITMQLLKLAPHLFRGYYSYDSAGVPISIWGSEDSDQVKIYEDNASKEEERFFGGKLTDDGYFMGVWHGDSTSFHFELHTDMNKCMPLNIYYSTDSVKLVPSMAASPVGTASNSIIWPDSSADSTLSKFLIQEITGSAKINDPHKYVRKAVDSFVLGYRLAARDVDSAEIASTSSASWNWTAENDMKVVWNTWPLLVIEKYVYDFTGGAHGNWGSSYKTLDLAKKEVLTPEKVFKPGYKEALAPFLDKAFRKKFHIDEDESLDQSLLVKTITPNNNFIMTDKGVAFSYSPYEIGPYALGQVTLFVPLSEIKNLMK
ncbi:DUF3298 domain-containing protein [Chitinophaga solisilvae]|uniref:DUF3298 domain-containing protein n=1 Tax=Chitinophaga solisilvae TaxID=1233460 RepID=A0A433WEY7_9BACT|nr:DUF3298 domain-containing protein [Chitinophaga solisilvae]NSL89584.1 DUF3298 domain-containing protein [Chitinophaga solisilvae]